MKTEEYIQVIVPMKLDWNPTYRVPAPWQGRVRVGDRVRVRLASRLTEAVVCRTGVEPGIAPDRIHPIEAVEEGLERITPEEIALWQFIADYYLCTQGEVFRCAYPSGKVRSEQTAARARERSEQSRRKMEEAARLRVSKLEAQIQEVQARYAAELGKLSERSVKTRQKLQDAQQRRLQQLGEALEKARALAESLQQEATQQGLRPSEKSGRASETDAAPARHEERKPMLLMGPAAWRSERYRALITQTLEAGHTALLLVPEIALTEHFEARMKDQFGPQTLIFHSRETTVCRRKIADALRQSGPHVLIGTRSALFLPYRDLSLVIVDEEQDRSYKQDSPAPRYNARDCAVVLSAIHGAQLYLGSATPSLETLYNCNAGRYQRIDLPEERALLSAPLAQVRLIDTAAERRKRGMSGSFSFKLIDQIRATLERGSDVFLIRLWGDVTPTLEEARALFPEVSVTAGESPSAQASLPRSGSEAADKSVGRILVGTLSQTRRQDFAAGSLVVLLQADPILSAQNFRADERAYQLLSAYREHCPGATFLIQTSRAEHPVFQALLQGSDPWGGLLEERKAFAYPPYSRIIDIDLSDPNPERLEAMCARLRTLLTRTLQPSAGPGGPVRLEGPYSQGEGSRTLRVLLAKDRQFPARKRSLKEAVDAFGRERKYAGFIHLDVDPE